MRPATTEKGSAMTEMSQDKGKRAPCFLLFRLYIFSIESKLVSEKGAIAQIGAKILFLAFRQKKIEADSWK